jgi:hypothetical protein
VAAPVTGPYDAILACVRAAERDGYAELELALTKADLRSCVAELRGFAYRVRFAFRAAAAKIDELDLRAHCDGWPVEQVTIDPPPATIVLVAQRRDNCVSPPAATLPGPRPVHSAGTAF